MCLGDGHTYIVIQHLVALQATKQLTLVAICHGKETATPAVDELQKQGSLNEELTKLALRLQSLAD